MTILVENYRVNVIIERFGGRLLLVGLNLLKNKVGLEPVRVGMKGK